MSFWKKIFNKNKIDKTQRKLENIGHSNTNLEPLINMVKPIIRSSTKIELESSNENPENTYLLSHFGGNPYFNKNETWPENKSCKPLSFVFQVFNNPDINLPEEIKLIQFYYDWEEFPWDTDNDGWLVKIYHELDIENSKKVDIPTDVEQVNYCEIKFKDIMSLPDWEGLDTYLNEALNLSCKMNTDEPWEPYEAVVKKLIGEQDYRSQFGGYPQWVQGESTPTDNNGKKLRLLFQIDSEENAGIMWGDVGLIYVFYDNETGKVEFTLQCH